MQWHNKLEMIYRVFVRQHEDVEHRINELVGRIEELMGATPAGELEFVQKADSYWPVAPEDVEKARARGLLLVEMSGGLYVPIKELVVTFHKVDAEEYEALVDAIDADVPMKFAAIRYVSETLTEIQAE